MNRLTRTLLASGLAALAPLGPAVGKGHRNGTDRQPCRGHRRATEPALDLAFEAVADHRGGQEGEHQDRRPPRVDPAQLADQLPTAEGDHRQGRPGVECHLEALAKLGIDSLPVPAREPGHHFEVSRTRDRQ